MQQYFGISKKDNNLYLNNDELNHIKNVMRMKENEEVFVDCRHGRRGVRSHECTD